MMNTRAFKLALAAGVQVNPVCKFLAKDLGVLKTEWVGDFRAANVKPPALTSDVNVWLEQAKARKLWPVAYAELPTVFRSQWHVTWQVNSGGQLTVWRDKGDVLDRFLAACGASLGNKPTFKPEVFGLAVPLPYALVTEALEDFGQRLEINLPGSDGWRMKDKQEVYTFEDKAAGTTYFVEKTQ